MTINDMAYKRLLGVHSSHELWTAYFEYLDIAMRTCPFDVVGWDKDEHTLDHLKTNKKWLI